MPGTAEIQEAAIRRGFCEQCGGVVEHSVRGPVYRAAGRPAETELWICPSVHLRLRRARAAANGTR